MKQSALLFLAEHRANIEVIQDDPDGLKIYVKEYEVGDTFDDFVHEKLDLDYSYVERPNDHDWIFHFERPSHVTKERLLAGIKSLADVRRYPCPCCGYATLEKPNDDEICPVCGWQDDGQDWPNADEIWGGPNKSLSLTQARLNFLEVGASDPTRASSRSDERTQYDRIRIFTKSVDGKIKED